MEFRLLYFKLLVGANTFTQNLKTIMKVLNKFWVTGVCIILFPFIAKGQAADSTWNLNRCIEYALKQNVSIQEIILDKEINKENLELSKASRFPSLNASAGQNFDWRKSLDNTTMQYGSYKGSRSSSLGLNSSVTLYNGFKINKTIKQSELSYKASEYDIETKKELISLSVLDAYLQVLYAGEQIKNSEKSVESIQTQLALAEERMKLRGISKSDYLSVKAELASENLTLANAQNLMVTNKISLMQLLELPAATTGFNIEHPQFGDNIIQTMHLKADSVYAIALGIKPQIKSQEINQQVAALNVAIARTGYLPKLTLGCDLTTGYSSSTSVGYGSEVGPNFATQIGNKITPSLNLNLSIPIFQKRQAKTEVALAKIKSKTAELELINTKNELRKNIEQACADVLAAEKKYESSQEAFNSANEAYNVAEEQYNVGKLSSVDYLIKKTNSINAENNFLQSKYNLVYYYKVLDFYLGKPLSF
jgi:outer membrane protein